MLRARSARRARGGGSDSLPYVDLNFGASDYKAGGATANTLQGSSALAGFTFTGASLRTMFDATGKLTYGPNNLLLQSNTFGTTWTTAGTVTSDARLAPDGTMTADKVASAGSITLTQAVTCPSSAIVFSVWAAKDSGATQANRFGVRNNTTATDLVFITLNYDTGAIAYTVGSTGASVVAEAGGWRITISVTAGITGGNSLVAYVGFVGAATSGQSAFFWGAQLEAVTYQTTPAIYYPTTTAAYYGPRLVYDPVTLASLGILVEEARTNIALYNRDLTNAAWVAVTMTTAKTETGIDGVANSASLITATGAGATLLQTVVLGSSSRQQSAYVKRITGSGTINMTTDGATWTAITVTSLWTRVTIPVQTVVNPVFGFQIATSGDAIAVDFVQNETGTGASSAIATTTASVTRAAEDVVLTGLSASGAVSAVFEAYTPAFVSTDARMSLSDGTTSNRITSIVSNTTSADIRVTVAAAGTLGYTATVAAGSLNKAAAASANGAYTGAFNGVLVAPVSGAVMPTLIQLDIGKNPGSSIRYWNAPIKRMRVYLRALSDAQLQDLSTIPNRLLGQEDNYNLLQESNSYIWLE